MGKSQQAHQVNIYVIKMLLWDYKGCQRALGVTLHLGALTCHTCTCPGPNVFFKARPNKLCPYKLGSSVDTWMGKAVNGVKNPAAPASRNERARLVGGDITGKRGISSVNHHVL